MCHRRVIRVLCPVQLHLQAMFNIQLSSAQPRLQARRSFGSVVLVRLFIMSRTLSVGLTHVSLSFSKLLSDQVRRSKGTLMQATLGRLARVSVVVCAAAADAANNLVPCSVQTVGQMQFSTAMVQQPVMRSQCFQPESGNGQCTLCVKPESSRNDKSPGDASNC